MTDSPSLCFRIFGWLMTGPVSTARLTCTMLSPSPVVLAVLPLLSLSESRRRHPECSGRAEAQWADGETAAPTDIREARTTAPAPTVTTRRNIAAGFSEVPIQTQSRYG